MKTKSVASFMKTEAYLIAASWNGNGQSFSPDGDGRVAIEMRGGYSVDEMRAHLADLERVQAAYDKWAAPVTAGTDPPRPAPAAKLPQCQHCTNPVRGPHELTCGSKECLEREYGNDRC